ncbi:DUF4065 domain-containing protein [Clostridium tertium]|uniref:DUF4065 domain-containing protein n=1 Tax=Clostridium tertium TaxID=1559 RepID=A0A9X4B2W0_9CLOT|nr:type II toxin-antitoxin system antitoxin SocA domain-containing protein [Clostridium tertium]MDC4240683.1 DUF4065 domain-containing protein [Clostridium tertium]
MITIFEVADFFLSKVEMSQKKLQKMCYYAYAWYLTLYDEMLFDNGKFEAWIHGPVNIELYHRYKKYGWRSIPKSGGVELSEDIEEFLNAIFNTFNEYTADQLETMTHDEAPWIEARNGIEADKPSNNKLDDEVIKNFYSKLGESGQLE